MLNEIFNTVLNSSSTAASFSIGSFLICTLCSLALGAAIAAAYMFRNSYSKGFAVTLALLPAIVQVVIMLVNGNLGAGVAVMGAFSLIRFRSVAGGAKEIGAIFLAMAVGLATGMGYVAIAALFAAIIIAAWLTLTATRFGEHKELEKDLRITIPESLDYSGAFDELFAKYTVSNSLVAVKTANMGSLFKLQYRIRLKDAAKEKDFIDELRCRNGNLEIVLGRVATAKDEL